MNSRDKISTKKKFRRTLRTVFFDSFEFRFLVEIVKNFLGSFLSQNFSSPWQPKPGPEGHCVQLQLQGNGGGSCGKAFNDGTRGCEFKSH